MSHIAVLGTGVIALEYIHALSQIPSATVRYVFGSDISRARAAATGFPGARATADLNDVLNDPNIDGVIVCGRTDTHHKRTLAALKAGKHVLLEKPPATSMQDFDELGQAAATSGARIMVAQVIRFQSGVRELAAQVRDGHLGRPHLVHLNWYVGHMWPGGWRAWQFDVPVSGGHLIHNGMHPLDLAIWLMGRQPTTVFARTWNTHAPKMPTPDSFHIVVGFEDHGLAMIELSYGLKVQGDSLRRASVLCEHGALTHHSRDDVFAASPRDPLLIGSLADGMVNLAAHVDDVFSGRSDPIVEWRTSRTALALAIGSRRSDAERRAVSVMEILDV